MPKSKLLSRDELDYIQQLLGYNLPQEALTSPTFKVDGGAVANALLASLGRQAQLQLEAHFGDQCLRFPLQLVEDEFQALHLEMGAPDIFQDGAVQRSWRLTLRQPLVLQHKDGATSDLCVHEISPSGVLVECLGELAAPDQFSLWLPLPQQEPIHLRARRVRSTPGALTAFRLEWLPENEDERLRHFLFQQHRLRHPQLRQRSA